MIGVSQSRAGGVRLLGLILLVALGFVHRADADMLGHGGMVRALAVSPDGARVLTGSFDYTARLWNFDDQTPGPVLDAHAGPVNSVAWLPDGKRLVTGGDDGAMILWDAATAQPIRRFMGHRAKIMAVAASPDGARLLSASWDRTVRVWETGTGRLLRRIDHPSDLTAVRFADRGRLIVTGARDGVLRLWRAADGVAVGELRGHAWVVTQIAVSPDGRLMLSAGTDATVRLWDLETRREIITLRGHEGPIYGVAFSPDGGLALSGGRDGTLVLWDVAARAQRRVIQTHVKPVWAVAFSRDGKFGLSAGSDGAVRVWHLVSGERIGIPGEGDAGPKPWLASNHPGARIYRKCAACHSLSPSGPRRSGPHFAGLFGRPAGAVAGYNYSKALRGTGIVWNERTLFALFDKGPDKFVPGTKMPVQRITRAEELRDLIAYMRELTAPGNGPAAPEASGSRR